MRAKIWWQPTIRSGSLTRRRSFGLSLLIRQARAATAPSGTNADDRSRVELRPLRGLAPLDRLRRSPALRAGRVKSRRPDWFNAKAPLAIALTVTHLRKRVGVENP